MGILFLLKDSFYIQEAIHDAWHCAFEIFPEVSGLKKKLFFKINLNIENIQKNIPVVFNSEDISNQALFNDFLLR